MRAEIEWAPSLKLEQHAHHRWMLRCSLVALCAAHVVLGVRIERSATFANFVPGGRAEILFVGPGVAMAFKRTAPSVQRGKNQQQRWSDGRDRVGRRYGRSATGR